MGNDVEKPAGVFGGRVTLTNTEALKNALASSAAADPRGGAADGSVYMNFSGKRGVFEIGKDKRNTEPDELWLVNVPAFEDGWICWKNGQAMAKRLAPLGTPVPVVDTNEHGPFTKDGDGWYQAKTMTIRSLDTGDQAYFAINSVSGVSEFAALQKEIVQRLMAGDPYWPIIGFDKEKFVAKGYTNFKPKIIVDGWLNDQQVTEFLPAVFDDPDAELDLEALYAEASAPKALPTGGGSSEATVARRTRRSA